MPKDADAFFNIIEKGELPPVIAIGGAERVYVDDAVAIVRKRALDGGMADFNHDRVSARDRSVPEVVSLCATLPVMARRRLVEVRDADQLKDLEALEAYLDKPAPETVLFLLFGDIDMRDKLPKLVDKKALLCRFDHPKERDMPAHAARRAKRLGLALDRDAADALAATVGADLTLLERALEKLALVVPEGGTISSADVEKHVADTHLEDAFAFARSVALCDRKAALSAMAMLQQAREEPIRIIGLLAWQLRQVARARAIVDEGGDAVRELNLFGDRLSTTMGAAKKLDMKGHGARLARLADADRLLKGSRQAPWLVMTRLVLDLTALPASSSTGARGGGAAAAPRAR